MKILITLLVTFFAGMGAGLGTGFAGIDVYKRQVSDCTGDGSVEYRILSEHSPGRRSGFYQFPENAQGRSCLLYTSHSPGGFHPGRNGGRGDVHSGRGTLCHGHGNGVLFRL